MKIGWRLALSVWWSAAWRQSVYVLLYAVFLGFLPDLIAVALHVPERAHLFAIVCAYLVGIPASILSLKQSVSSHLPTLAKIVSNAQT